MRNGESNMNRSYSHTIVKMFLNDEYHKELYRLAHENPTTSNKEALDETFKQFFTRVKVIQYISKLISGYSIDYDKRIRKHEQSTSIDSLFEKEGHASLLDVIQSGDVLADIEQVNDEKANIEELFENKVLATSFKHLKPEQQSVLIYSFFYGYKNKEIAKLLAISEQRVSYYKKRALHILKQQMILGEKAGETDVY
ncbi:sigma-70 family RNA polymerase sigma factor [Bacillus sp. JCM 19041]|uniref:sigma-70 family RNA polymerase sigma factor n=1 Tax=Bacillus sp. JCM 19041 TaxID=1460637 RepID=UPI0006CF317C